MRWERIVDNAASGATGEPASVPRVAVTNGGGQGLKRGFDVLLSGLGLLFSLPLWGLIGLLIWLEDGFPIFILQERVGKGGQLFFSLKFRSMVRGAETMSAKEDVEEDSRVTRVGRWLRATAMDELPQLWNIFVGDMSFVGPRALAPTVEDTESLRYRTIFEIPGFETRSRVRPGLTGIAQVYGPKDLPRQQKFRYDALYVKHQSLLLDLKLIAMSFWITFRGKWESRGKKF